MPPAPLCQAGIHDRDLAVRIGAEPLAVVLQRGTRRGEVAAGLRLVLRLQEQPHLDRRQPGSCERRHVLDEVRARRPGEVVHVGLVVVVRRRPVAEVAQRLLDAGGADDPSGRDGQADVVDAEVGEELGVPRGTGACSSPCLRARRSSGTSARGSRSRRCGRCGRRCAARAMTSPSAPSRSRPGRPAARAAAPPPSGRPGSRRLAR
jgi:hypothetical protein